MSKQNEYFSAPPYQQMLRTETGYPAGYMIIAPVRVILDTQDITMS